MIPNAVFTRSRSSRTLNGLTMSSFTPEAFGRRTFSAPLGRHLPPARARHALRGKGRPNLLDQRRRELPSTGPPARNSIRPSQHYRKD